MIEDNGKGFDPNSTRAFGNGIRNMKERMKAVNGSFQIDSAPGKGTRTMLTFPVLS